MNRREFTKTLVIPIVSGLSVSSGCLEDEGGSERLVIEDGTATTNHEEREVTLSGTVENEGTEAHSGTIIGKITIRETEEIFRESKEVTLNSDESTPFELTLSVESPSARLNYSYLITVED
jgi:hypothetical protein